MNWNKFAIKNENKEQWAFEQMAYLLFCSEFDNNVGLFRYKNQTGIETEPLEKDGVVMVSQLNTTKYLLVIEKKKLLRLLQKPKVRTLK